MSAAAGGAGDVGDNDVVRIRDDQTARDLHDTQRIVRNAAVDIGNGQMAANQRDLGFHVAQSDGHRGRVRSAVTVVDFDCQVEDWRGLEVQRRLVVDRNPAVVVDVEGVAHVAGDDVERQSVVGVHIAGRHRTNDRGVVRVFGDREVGIVDHRRVILPRDRHRHCGRVGTAIAIVDRVGERIDGRLACRQVLERPVRIVRHVRAVVGHRPAIDALSHGEHAQHIVWRVIVYVRVAVIGQYVDRHRRTVLVCHVGVLVCHRGVVLAGDGHGDDGGV